MLDLGDLLTLIRLVQIEIFDLQSDINRDDEEARDNAGELIVQVDELSSKLKNLYESKWDKNSNYPSYENFINDLKNHPPFNIDR